MAYGTRYEPADIIIHVQGKGIVVKEKSLVAFGKNDNKYVAFGAEAERIAATDMENIVIISPLRQGMVEEYVTAVALFSHLLKKARGKKSILKPKVAICVPQGITAAEKKIIEEVMIGAGASELLVADIPAQKFIQEFPEKLPKDYRKFKITVGITKEEPERYIEERLRDTLAYAEQEQISPERVCELLQKVQQDLGHKQG